MTTSLDDHNTACAPAEITDDIVALEVLGPHLEPRRYEKGRVLWAEGETSGRLTFLEHGRVKILRSRPDGGSVLLYVFGPGTLFGFLPFLDGSPYPATAIALDTVEARVMSRAALRRLLEKDYRLSLVLLSALGTRLRDAFARIEQLSRRDALGRAVAALVTAMPESSPSGGEPMIIDVPRPAGAFATEVGLTPETFSRAITRLVKHGVLHRLSAGRLQILDATVLHRLAAGGPLEAPHR